MRALSILLLAACGRIGFDPRAGLQDADSDALPLVCNLEPTTPLTLDVSGTTFRYMTFDNMSTPVASVAVALRSGATDLGQTVSDGTGNYTIRYQTGGVSRPLVIEYTRAGFFRTTVFTDLVVDEDLMGRRDAIWQLGDGPVWDLGAMQTVYGAAGEPLDQQTGTLNVAVLDCAGNGIAGVTVSVDPPPAMLRYQDTDGSPAPLTRTTTVDPFNHVIGFRAQPGTTKITAVGDGRTFLETTVQVRAGDENTLAIVRAID